MERYIFPVLSTFFASLFFGLSLSAPKRALFSSAFLGFFGFFIYTAANNAFGNEYIAVFFGTLAASVPAEYFARTLKTPATVIIFISVIPLVPGLMLYNAMKFFADNNLISGAFEIVRTLIYTGCMAIAITIAAMLGKHLLSPLFRKTSKNHTEETD